VEKVLAIETSSKAASLALLQGRDLVASVRLSTDQDTTSIITPALKTLCEDAGWKPGELELIAVTTGPGSFTGLRIGVMMAKTMAYVSGCKVMGINTLHAIAARCGEPFSELHVVMDAQRRQFFRAVFDQDDSGRFREVAPTEIVDQATFFDSLTEGESVTGTGLVNRLDKIPGGVRVIDQAEWSPTAESVGRLALAAHQAGHHTDFWSLSPHYFRKSAAEEKLEADSGLA